MTGLIMGLIYLMIGILFLKLYKIYFLDSYNFMCFMFNDYSDYNKNTVYKESAGSIWGVLLIYPFIITWLILSRGLKYTTKLIKWWVE